jgi:hypothetical protein
MAINLQKAGEGELPKRSVYGITFRRWMLSKMMFLL